MSTLFVVILVIAAFATRFWATSEYANFVKGMTAQDRERWQRETRENV